MSTTPTEDRPSKTSRAIGVAISVLIVAFMLFDAISHILKPKFVLDASVGMFPENQLVPIGVVALIVTVLYAIPRTAILGAVLLRLLRWCGGGPPERRARHLHPGVVP